MSSVLHDLRYGLRGVRQQPAFTALAVVTLGLGIGASTTIFSVVQNVLIDPFPYDDVDRVVNVRIVDQTRPRAMRMRFSAREFLEYKEQSRSFEDVIAGGNDDVLYTTPEGTERFNGGYMTPNNFRFLGSGAIPLVGRTFTAEDARPGAPPVFVLRHEVWVNRFGRDESLIGKTFVLNGVPTTLIGVMQPRFSKLGGDVYLPVALERMPDRNAGYFMLQGRLKRGVSLAEAEAELGGIAQRVAKSYPERYPAKFTVSVVSLLDNTVGRFRTTLYTMSAAVGLLLLIACGNVANMLLARATAREREMAVRASLGATRSRLVRQLLVESVLLALLASAFGALCAWVGIHAIVRAIPRFGFIPGEAVIRLDLPALLFSLGLAVLTALLFGLVPALRTARRDLVSPLRAAGKGTGAGLRHPRLNGFLVAGQVALSLVLLAGAGLLTRSFIKLQTVELGQNLENVLIVRLPLPKERYATAEAKNQFFDPLLARVQALPGVVSATVASSVPPFGGMRTEIDVPGKVHAERWDGIFHLCSEGYFRTLERGLLRGRLITAADVAERRQVAVINRALAERYFGADDPIGRPVDLRGLPTPQSPPSISLFEVVGILSDARNQGVRDPLVPEAFIPYSVTGAYQRGVLVRTAGDPLALLEPVRGAVWAVDRNVPVTDTGSLADILAGSLAEPRLGLLVFGLFAGIALVLVVLGVFSLLAYTVSRRTHEIGVRMALGAERADILRMVIGMGARLVGAGLAVGLLASLAATRVLAGQLFGVEPHDPLTLAAVALIVLGAGLAACFFPARAATRVEPMVALRHE